MNRMEAITYAFLGAGIGSLVIAGVSAYMVYSETKSIRLRPGARLEALIDDLYERPTEAAPEVILGTFSVNEDGSVVTIEATAVPVSAESLPSAQEGTGAC